MGAHYATRTHMRAHGHNRPGLVQVRCGTSRYAGNRNSLRSIG